MKTSSNGKMGNLPFNINLVTPVAKADAQQITQLIKHNGRVDGYVLSNGKNITKQEGVALAKAGEIKGVAIAVRNGNEYLRSLPDESGQNNLGNLPSISQ